MALRFSRFRIVLSTVLLLGLVLGIGDVRTDAQDASNPLIPGFDTSAGVHLDVLAEGIAQEVPEPPFQFRFERMELDPGATISVATNSGPSLYFFESGSIGIVDELGIEAVYGAGRSQFVDQGIVVEITGSGSDAASLLVLSLVPSFPSGTSEASTDSMGTPTAVFGTPVAVSPGTTLFDSQQTAVLTTPARLVLARLTLEPGAGLARHTFSGPVALLAEEGSLTLAGPSGLEGKLNADKPIVFPAGVANLERNDTDGAVSVLMVAALPAGAPLVEPIESPATATPSTGDVAALIQTGIAEESSPEPEATSTPKPEPEVLYQATGPDAFSDWETGGAWASFQGYLLFDGSVEESVILAPVDLGIVSDYAIEAEIMAPTGSVDPGWFGIVVGLANDQPVLIAAIDYIETGYCCGQQTQFIWNGEVGPGYLAEVDAEWHRYRLEIRGNQAALYIDGTLVLEGADNRLVTLADGKVGFIGEGPMQMDARSFMVSALDE